jgi:beta-lactamase regulating signal transducer with metallopeptidase domain
MESASRFIVAFVLNAAWQVPVVALAAAAGARLLPSAAARHRLLLAAVGLGLVVPSAASFAIAVPSRRAAPATAPHPAESAAPTTGSGWLAGAPARSVSPAPPVAGGLVAVYAACLAASARRRVRAWRRTAALRRSAAGTASLEVLRVAEECRRRLGLGVVEVRFSREVTSPVTLGTRRPMILIPEALAGALGGQPLLAALGHEMAHVRRRDFAWNAAAELASWPVSFHPAVAWLRRRLAEQRELACDALVAERLLEPRAYARSLAALARMLAPAPALTLGVADAGILEERVMSLVTGRSRRRAGLASSVAAAALLAAASMVGATFAVAVETRGAGAAAVLGSWTGRIPGAEDVPAADLKIAEKDGKLSGRVTFYRIHESADGHREVAGQDVVDMLEPSFDGGRLTFKLKNPKGEIVPMALRLTGKDEGELGTQVTVGDRGDQTESRGMVVKMKRAK